MTMGTCKGNFRMDPKWSKLYHQTTGNEGRKNPGNPPEIIKTKEDPTEWFSKNSRYPSSCVDGNTRWTGALHGDLVCNERMQEKRMDKTHSRSERYILRFQLAVSRNRKQAHQCGSISAKSSKLSRVFRCLQIRSGRSMDPPRRRQQTQIYFLVSRVPTGSGTTNDATWNFSQWLGNGRCAPSMASIGMPHAQLTQNTSRIAMW